MTEFKIGDLVFAGIYFNKLGRVQEIRQLSDKTLYRVKEEWTLCVTPATWTFVGICCVLRDGTCVVL